MIETLKELKKLYPGLITTSGNTYYIDGFGWYKQRNTFFGLETCEKGWDDTWHPVNFEKIVKEFENLHK